MGYYSISLINHIFNTKPKKVFGKILKKVGVDLKFYGEIHFTNNKIGTFCSSFLDKNDDSTTIIGEKGKLVIPSTFLRGEKKIFIIKNNKKKILFANEIVHRYEKEVKNIVQTVNKKEKLVVSMKESTKNVYCMEKLKASSKTNKYIKL